VAADEDLDLLLQLYEVDPDDRPRYYEAAKFAREKGWWDAYGDRDAPDWFKPYVGLEQGATRIRAVEPFIVPGLLQTREYAVEVLRTDLDRWVDRQVERIVEFRMRRQGILTDDDPTSLDVVMDESVLRRTVRDPALMVAQLAYIGSLARLPNVTVRVFPFERGINQGMVGAYRILDLGLGLRPAVYLEHRNGANWLEDLQAVEDQIAAFEFLAAEALGPEESIALLERLGDEHDRRR
jgi:hypothetical protein